MPDQRCRADGLAQRRRGILFGAALAIGGAAVVGAAVVGSPAIAAGAWPERPIRLVVPYPPGGPLDQVGRALADAMRAGLGQPVIVDNKPGAGGNIGADAVAKSAPDGYTIVMGAVATHAINPWLYSKMPYDAERDFTPITRIAVVPNVLVMTPERAAALSIGSVADLVSYAKAHPGKLNFASGGNGSAGHLAGELLKRQAGIEMVHVPYKGAAPAKTGLLGGETDLMFDNLASAMPQIQAKRLEAMAVTTAARDASAPDLPTVAESGLPDFDISTWFGLFGPAGLDGAVLEKLHAASVAAMQTPALTQTLARMGATASPMQPKAFGSFVRSERLKYEAVVKASGAKAD
ncbi:MAG: Bug family tripartite tricarboxylate transporter substrate binding protein [Lautropia sp.]